MSINRRSVPLIVVAVILGLMGTAAVAFYLTRGFSGGQSQSSSSSSELGGGQSQSSSSSVELNGVCHSANWLPDHACTPGSIDPSVTQDNIQSTICVPGYSSSVRPPVSYTHPLKLQSIRQYGYSDTNPADYEYDHLIPLELGGNPTDTKNLWAQPSYGTYTSFDKDGFENYLHGQVCSGALTLAQAQMEIATDWVRYWMAAGEP